MRIEFPDNKPPLKMENGSVCIFCLIRRRWLHFTPEEWVRQCLLLYLTEVIGFPAALMRVEKQLKVGDRVRRFDILVYDRQQNPYLLVECKEPDFLLTSAVWEQALHYYTAIQSRYLMISNGTVTYCLERSGDTFAPTEKLHLFD